MLTEILEAYRSSTYDFRTVACPDDPLVDFFPQWVSYYRLKFAIARVLRPKSVLEIGVRFGYGGAAFLAGSPYASYRGIDLDSEAFGGHFNAVAWARKILGGPPHEIILADSQKMDRFPGGIYDLIHVDGQQDGDGTYHDLEKALRQARYVLVDGYFWSADNLNAASHFMREHQQEIEFALIIPGYSGELLIKSREVDSTSSSAQNITTGSAQIREQYNRAYYLTDCGGWDSFRGGWLADRRLGSIFDLCFITPPARLLDLGCGRGEVAASASCLGTQVVAIDYSPDAIALARSHVADHGDAAKVEFHCADATQLTLSDPVDVAVAGDLIEHLAPNELDELYRNVASQLKPTGRFVVHTFPNKWLYQYDYVAKRRQAAALGAYLPPNPRSTYERSMHINEQSPRVLRDQLRRFFPHVLVWLGSMENPGGSLLERYGHRRAAGERDLFAIASHQPIKQEEIVALFSPSPLDEATVALVQLTGDMSARNVAPAAEGELMLTLRNGSGYMLSSHGPHPVMFASHWVDAATGAMIIHDGERSRLVPCSPPGSVRRYRAYFKAPARPGNYCLQMTLLQEHVRWFDWTNPSTRVEISVAVSEVS